MTTELNATIVGAGPVGITAAMYLERRGYRVTVYEGRPDPRVAALPRGRSINLTLSVRGWHALREVGAEAAVRRLALPLTGRRIHARDGSASVHRYGPHGEAISSISRNLLSCALLDVAAQRPGIRLEFSRRLIHLDVENGALTFDDPQGERPVETVRSERVLVADGTSSTARTFLLADRAEGYRHSHLSYCYKELNVPPAADGGWALDPESTHIWPRHESLLCLFPNVDRSFSGTLFMPLESGSGGGSFGSLSTVESLRAYFERVFPDLLPLNPSLGVGFFARPTSLIQSIRCAPWTWRGRFALMGDAAHSVTPVLGQGLNCGLEDCTVLDECLASTTDWADALARYEAERRPNADALAALAENHFAELSVHAADPVFVLKKEIEQRLQTEFSGRFVPLYSVIAFTRLPYAEAPKLAAWQGTLVAKLARIDRVLEVWGSDAVQRVIAEHFQTPHTELPHLDRGERPQRRVLGVG